MRVEMIKTDRLDMWEKDMEGDITQGLSVLDDRMRKLEIGGWMMPGGSYVTNDTHLWKSSLWKRIGGEN